MKIQYKGSFPYAKHVQNYMVKNSLVVCIRDEHQPVALSVNLNSAVMKHAIWIGA